MSEVILSAAAGNLAEVNGVLRTVVVASQTAGAAAVVMPNGEAIGQRDVARGTHLLALPAMDTDLAVDGELLVRHHLTIEIAAHHMAHHPRGGSFPDMRFSCFSIDNQLCELPQLFLGTGNLPLLLLGGVGIHKRQTDIAFRHH